MNNIKNSDFRVTPVEQSNVSLDTNFGLGSNLIQKVGGAGLAFVSLCLALTALNSFIGHIPGVEYPGLDTSGLSENPINLNNLWYHLANPYDREVGTAFLIASAATAITALKLLDKNN